MKATLLIIAVVAVVGCGKSLEDKVVGKYSAMVGLPLERADGKEAKGGGDKLELFLRDGGIAEVLVYDGKAGKQEETQGPSQPDPVFALVTGWWACMVAHGGVLQHPI